MSKLVLRSLAAGVMLAASGLASRAATAASTAIYDATGGTENGGDSFQSAGRLLVDEFVTGSKSETLSSVVLNVLTAKAGIGQFDVVLATVRKNGLPGGPRTIIATIADKSLTKTFALTTVTPTHTITLAPNTHYFIGIAGHPGNGSRVTLGNTVDPAVLARPSVEAGGFYYNNGGLQANSGGPYEVKVNVTP